MRTRLLALLAVLLLAGCGIPAESTPRVIPADSASPNGSPSTPSSSPVRGPQQQVKIYFVQDKQIVPVLRLVTRSPSPNALLGALLNGPDEREKAEGFRSVASGAFAKASADQRRPPTPGPVTVKLPPADANGEQLPTDQILGYAQIVLTLTADDNVTGVIFVRDKQQIQVPRANSNSALSPEGQPVTAGDYSSLLKEAPK